MKQIKARWDAELSDSKRTAQKQIDNAKRFRKEGWGNQLEQEEEAEQVVNEISGNQKQLELMKLVKTRNNWSGPQK